MQLQLLNPNECAGSRTRQQLDQGTTGALLSLTDYFSGHDPSTASPLVGEASLGDGDFGSEDARTPDRRKRRRSGEALSKRKRSGEAHNEPDDHERTGSSTNPRHPWGPFLNLKTLELAPAFVQHLEEHRTDVILFLNDGNSLQHRIAHFDHNTVGDALMACYKYTKQLKSRSTME